MNINQFCLAQNRHIKELLIKLAREARLKEDKPATTEATINSQNQHYNYFFIDDHTNRGFGLGCCMSNEPHYEQITLEKMIDTLIKSKAIDFLINNQVMKYYPESKQFNLGDYSLPIERLKEIINQAEKSNLP